MNPNRREFLALGVGALAVATLPRAVRPRDRLVRRTIPVMGTIAELAVRTRNEEWAQRAIDAALDDLRRVDRTMSRFRDDSDVGRANLAAGHGRVAVSEDTAEVLSAALMWAQRSDGRFDPCLGRVSELWHVETRRVPPPMAEVRPLQDGHFYRDLELDLTGSVPYVLLHSRRAAVDLGGIAKGYAVDLASRTLRDHGMFNALVNAGGDLMAMGTDDHGKPWKIGVRDPDHLEQVAAVLEVSDRAVATSGDYLRFFKYHGHLYHHLMDPITGEPWQTHMRSITVEAANCMTADAAATALYGENPASAREVLARAAPGARVVNSIS
jgi:thiamine biosynthesis lipoprotein